jgi:hypothetical protein
MPRCIWPNAVVRTATDSLAIDRLFIVEKLEVAYVPLVLLGGRVEEVVVHLRTFDS